MTAFHELARISAERMLNGVVEGMVIGLLAAAILRITGRWASGTRFAVLLAALFSMAALPLLQVARASAGSALKGGALWSITLSGLWATYIVLAWAAISGVGLFRIALGLWQLRKLRSGAEIIDTASLHPALRNTLSEFDLSRRVRIAVSEKLTVPAAIGFFRPMIMLPKWALRELSEAELNSILIHELAHLQRRDDWTNLVQKVLGALLFFHPAVWWVERQLSFEREMACDEVVLSHTSNPRAYAECLVTVAERSLMLRGVALAQAAVSKMRQTTLRVSEILDSNRSSSKRMWKPALALVTIGSGIFVAGLARAPELIALRDTAPVVSLASIPAPLPTDVSPIAAKTALASSKSTPVRKFRANARAIEARATAPQPVMESPAKAMLAGLSQNETAAQTVLVVMRTAEFGPLGANWTIQVWRFTMLRDEQIPIGLKLPSKSL